MAMGRYFILAILIVVVGFVGYQIYGLFIEHINLENEKKVVKEESELLTKENNKIKEEITRLKKPENLIKEIKSKFNYRFPEERTIIVAP